MLSTTRRLVDKVLLGYGTPGISPVQPDATTGAWTPGPDDPDLSFNIAAANKMLDDAGYTMGPDGVRIDPKSGKPLDFRFFSRSSDQNSIDIVPYVSGWMQQIGIKLEPQTLNSSKLGNVILAGDYDLFEWGWYPNPDPNYILDIFTCAQRPPDANTYRNSDMLLLQPGVRHALQAAGSGDDAATRADIVHQMQAILYRDQPYIVLWNDASLEAYSSNWTGFKPQPDPNGDVLATYGPLSFVSIRPVSGTSAGERRLVGRHPGRRLDRRPRGGRRHRRGFAHDPEAPRGGRRRGIAESREGTNEGEHPEVPVRQDLPGGAHPPVRPGLQLLPVPWAGRSDAAAREAARQPHTGRARSNCDHSWAWTFRCRSSS